MTLEATVDIKGIAIGGAGVGTISEQSTGTELLGITAFVPYTTGGDQVRVVVDETKKNYIKGTLKEIIQHSEDRIEPRCRYYMQCGGCELQHISYDAQLDAKYKMLIGAMRSGRIPQEVISTVQPIVASSPFSYRRRITLHLDQQGRIGFYRPASRSVVPITSCEISVSAISDSLNDIQDLGRLVAGRISSIILETDARDLVSILKSPYQLTSQEQKQILDSAKNHFSNVSLIASDKEVGGFGKRILDLPLSDSSSSVLKVPAGHFSQINWNINRKLIKEVVAEIREFSEPKVFDLFAGAGNFSIPIAQAGGIVTAVETDSALVELAKENIASSAISSRIFFSNTSVEKFLAQKHRCDVIVSDPPRNGLGSIIPKLPAAKLLIAIFCHTPSLVRDLKGLIENGWQVERITPFDMFAQTSYLETMVVLKRK